MRNSLSSETQFQVICKRISRILNRWWVKYLALPVFQMLPPAILLYVLRSDGKIPDIPSYYHYSLEIIFNHPFITVTLIVVYIIIWKAIIGFFDSYSINTDEIDVKSLLILFEVLENIVAAKADRFGGFVKGALKQKKVDANVIFDEITKPEQQIALIAKGLYAFFDSIDDKGISFRITVADINDNKPIGWFFNFPASDPPRTSIESLQNQDSSICYCINKKSIIVIEDINKESEKANDRHFHPRDDSKDEEGSLICYPILHTHTGTIPYVITIVADKKDYFLNKKIQLYKWIFKHFAVRINLEHSLLTVKGKAKNGPSK